MDYYQSITHTILNDNKYVRLICYINLENDILTLDIDPPDYAFMRHGQVI
jgi:hypothetical protein